MDKRKYIKHGLTHHPLFKHWSNMIDRCYHQSYPGYENYGGRGIVVCDEWLDVRNFIAWAEQTHIEGRTLDRIDTNGNYTPENCRWATTKEQSMNKRTTRNIQLGESTRHITEWCEVVGMNPATVKKRHSRGMPWEIALITPLRRHKRNGR